MQKLIKLSLLVLLVSNVNATMMPKNKIKDKVLKIHEYEIEVSKDIGREIADIVREELVEGDYIIGKVWNEQQERFLAQSDERIKEVGNCLSKAGLKKVRKASQQRQKDREGELLYWKDIRAKRLAKEVKGGGNSNSNPVLARVNKYLGLDKKEIQKQEYVLKQESKPVLNEDATLKKVAWKNRGMTKDEMLRKACIYGATKITLVLIKEGANVNYIDKGDKTPLHWAVITQNIKVVKLLIREGVEVNQKDCFGKTPLYYVLETGDVSLAKLLIDAGTNIDSKDDNIRNVLEYGIWRNNIPSSSSIDNKRRLKVINYIRSVVEEKKRLNRAGIIEGAGEDLDIYPV